jgi:hypothetical protein
LEANQTGLVDYGFANFLVRLWLAQNQTYPEYVHVTMHAYTFLL